jgi:osmoprotectant transport system substrate-binding protein
MRRHLAFAAVLVLAAACQAGGAARRTAVGDATLTIGSFNFPESQILAELYAQALERRGFAVDRRFGLGPRELVEPMLERGLVELVPEYSGSLLQFLTRSSSASSDLAEVRTALLPALADRGLAPLASAPAQDRNAFAVARSFADASGLHRISDLAAHTDLILGGPPECEERPLCMAGLETTYGIAFGDFVALDLSGPLTADALSRGIVDVALVLTTSAQLSRHDFALLRDDRHLQPAEHVTPVVRSDALARFGTPFADAIDAVSARLTTADLRGLNADVELDGTSPAAAARAWLDANGFGPEG